MRIWDPLWKNGNPEEIPHSLMEFNTGSFLGSQVIILQWAPLRIFSTGMFITRGNLLIRFIFII